MAFCDGGRSRHEHRSPDASEQADRSPQLRTASQQPPGRGQVTQNMRVTRRIDPHQTEATLRCPAQGAVRTLVRSPTGRCARGVTSMCSRDVRHPCGGPQLQVACHALVRRHVPMIGPRRGEERHGSVARSVRDGRLSRLERTKIVPSRLPAAWATLIRAPAVQHGGSALDPWPSARPRDPSGDQEQRKDRHAAGRRVEPHRA